MKTKQTSFWEGDFGKEYTDRNSRDAELWDSFYIKNWGLTKIEMNEKCFGELSRDIKILEVGCNTGMQLEGLQRMGFKNLYGLELQPYAVEKAKEYTKGINIVQGSGFDIPFKTEYFDLVCTNGVLIHISPDDLGVIMKEIYRCTKKYIMGFEYYADNLVDLNYRGKEGYMWKADYSQLYIQNIPKLSISKKTLYSYVAEENKNNVDCMFLLKK